MSEKVSLQTIQPLVDRVAKSGIFGASERQVALLSYLVNEELSGRGEALKAYSIGTDVLGRGTRFDPAQDAIVRVEIGRLRKSLDLYFATVGREEPLRIVIEKGNYRPHFIQNTPPPATPTTTFSAPDSSGGGWRRWARIAGIGLMGMLAVVEVIHLSQSFFGSETTADDTPQLVIAMPEVSGLGTASERVKFSLQAALAQELRSRSWLSVAIGGQIGAPARSASFTLRPALSNADGQWTLTAFLTRGPEREVVWTGRYDGRDNLLEPDTLRRAIAAPINQDLGPMTGPIAEAVAIQSVSTIPDTSTAFGCIVNVRRFLRYNTQRQFADSKACVTRHIQTAPTLVELRAILTYLLILEAVQPNLSPLPTAINGALVADREVRREALLNEADNILRGASPTDRVMLQQRLILAACRGQTNVIREHLPFLLAFNSRVSDPYIIRAVIMGPVLGDWETAVESEAMALSMTATPTPRYQIVSGLRAAMDDKPVEALRLLTRAPMHSYPLGHLLVGLFAAEAGSPLHVRAARAQLRELGFKDETAFDLLIGDSCYSDDVKARLRRALKTFVTFKPD
ncbi:MAG: hypothetical protein LCH39_12510 [Proteobacteria bacterium]|nr:hypothetical protein [Pseudomonadota bacterium]